MRARVFEMRARACSRDQRRYFYSVFSTFQKCELYGLAKMLAQTWGCVLELSPKPPLVFRRLLSLLRTAGTAKPTDSQPATVPGRRSQRSSTPVVFSFPTNQATNVQCHRWPVITRSRYELRRKEWNVDKDICLDIFVDKTASPKSLTPLLSTRTQL